MHSCLCRFASESKNVLSVSYLSRMARIFRTKLYRACYTIFYNCFLLENNERAYVNKKRISKIGINLFTRLDGAKIKMSESKFLKGSKDIVVSYRYHRRNHQSSPCSHNSEFSAKSLKLPLIALTSNMPSGSGYNSQGNHYNTPGGTNSSGGSSYHCKF